LPIEKGGALSNVTEEAFFELIELWVENEVLLELLPPNLMQQYLVTMQPENLKAMLDAAIAVGS
jgi:hypothetical protein